MSTPAELRTMLQNCLDATTVSNAVWVDDFTRDGWPVTTQLMFDFRSRLVTLIKFTTITTAEAMGVALSMGGIEKLPPMEKLEKCWKPRKGKFATDDETKAALATELELFRERYDVLMRVINDMRTICH